jgi:hypothetical protein
MVSSNLIVQNFQKFVDAQLAWLGPIHEAVERALKSAELPPKKPPKRVGIEEKVEAIGAGV